MLFGKPLMAQVHPTALVDPRAKLAQDVTVGPFTVIDGDVEIGAGTTIGAHNVITGHTKIGRDNRIFHFSSIGEANQDKKYKGEPTRLAIGDRNTIREYCTINRGTVQDAGITKIGAHVMVGAASIVLQDIPPYVLVAGHPCAPHGINSEGLKRRGFSPASIESIRRAYKTLYRSGLGFEEAKQGIADQAREVPELQVLVEFLASSTRGVIR